MGNWGNWYQRWRWRKSKARPSELVSLTMERLENRQMLTSAACFVLDFSSPTDLCDASLAIEVSPGGVEPFIDKASAADSDRFVYLDELAEELGNVFELEDDDLWWMDSDHSWGSQST